jgi:SAM-dependent methyltransferase
MSAPARRRPHAPPAPGTYTPADEEAGARESFEDPALYDHEYRRRRADVTFYRRLVAERLAHAGPGPVLDLACGSGRLIVPLVRDGHTVVGLDRSAAMLGAAHARLRRLGSVHRRRALILRADLRRFAFAPRFAIAVCAFHSVQHLVADADLLAFLRCARRALRPGGWLVFDTLPPDPDWIGRDPTRRWARTVFRHPRTGERLVYTTNHTYDARRKALHIRVYYQPVDARGRPAGPERVVRLCHRQLTPGELERLLARAGFSLVGVLGSFDGRALEAFADESRAEQHVYIARASTPVRPSQARRSRGGSAVPSR